MTAPGMGRGDVWMLPLRKPVVGADGSLRLGYWKANDALLGAPLVESAAANCSAPGGGYGVSWLRELSVAQHRSGAYLNATLRASGDGSVGLALADFGAPLA